MSCNSRNGKTYFNSLTPYPGATAASAPYLLSCTHYTCGNRKMCVNSAEGFPLASNLDVQVLGAPRLIGTDTYCVDVRCVCDLTYQQVYNNCNCGCNDGCLRTEKIVVTQCVPCSSDVTPTVVANGVIASPADVACGCSSTNVCNIDFAFTLETAAGASEGNG